MNLDPESQAALDASSLDYDTAVEGGHVCVIFHRVELPNGYDLAHTDILVRLPAGFPDAGPDMFWAEPALTISGTLPAGTEHNESHLGRVWQRWSRHIGPHWRSGVDDIGTYVAYVRQCLAQPATQSAAA